MSVAQASRTAYRTCPLCEATCGLELTIEGDRVTRVRGDADDVFSKGFICPKGASLHELHEDPDRLRNPVRRREDGSFEPVSWDEAFAEIAERVAAIDAEHGRQAFSAYIGNPSTHSIGALLYGRVLLKALGTRNVFTASTVDQAPKQLASALMFGTGLSVPIPDIDRTQHFLILGADPMVSNGSLMTAPDVRGRLRAIRARGGKIVVVDPRRSRTAGEADEHHFIRPGTDALLLFALVQVLFDEHLAAPQEEVAEHLAGLDELPALAAPFAPEAVADATGIAADEIRRMARELVGASSAAVYGRIGTTTQPFGALTSWLVDVLNILTGNLDRPGGAMFTLPATGSSNTSGEPGRGRGLQMHRWTTRVSGLGEVFGELPAVSMHEEMTTPGDGRIRALITLAGNPVLSTPNGDRLAEALAGSRPDRQHRPVHQRDDAPRASDPAAAVHARARALRRGLLRAVRCATSPTTRRRCSIASPARSTSGRSSFASRRSSRARAPTPTSPHLTASSPASSAGVRSAPHAHR